MGNVGLRLTRIFKDLLNFELALNSMNSMSGKKKLKSADKPTFFIFIKQNHLHVKKCKDIYINILTRDNHAYVVFCFILPSI